MVHSGKQYRLGANVSKYNGFFSIFSQGHFINASLYKQCSIITSSCMVILYFAYILTALIFCSSAVLWKSTCHFLCWTGLWCLDIWAGNYGEFKMEYNIESRLLNKGVILAHLINLNASAIWEQWVLVKLLKYNILFCLMHSSWT